MSNKAAIRQAEEDIEKVLQKLQDDHGIHTFRIQILNEPEWDTVEVTIIKDERY